jgi:hypothetical protein
MRCVPLLALLGAATASSSSPPSSSSCPPLTLSPASPLSSISPSTYASWNIDSSRNRAFFDTDWAAPQLVYLASAIGGARIRFGGSGNDFLNYSPSPYPSSPPCPPQSDKAECLNATTAADLFAFAGATDSALVFGLNIHPASGGPSPPKAPWNSSNARALLSWALATNQTPHALELGNEQNDLLTAKDQADAFVVLSALLDSLFAGKPASLRPRLVGPDTHGFHNASDQPSNAPILRFLADFAGNLSAAGVALDALTHHEYIEIDQDSCVDPAFLDQSLDLGRQVVAAARSVDPSLPVWAGEIGPHNGDGTTSANSICSANHVCGRFGSTLWYADALGAKAKAGYAGFMRQDLVGADYALLNTSLGTAATGILPSPDYYLLLLWREIFANQTLVLEAAPPAGSPPTTRAYSFCGAGGQATLVLLNLDNGTSSTCVGPPAQAAPGSTMRVYTLTPAQDAWGGTGVTSAAAALNGVTLALGADGKLPPIPPALIPLGPLTLPPLSITLVALSLAAGQEGACGSGEMRRSGSSPVRPAAAASPSPSPSPPTRLRADLTAATPANPFPLLTLDALAFASPNVSLTWELPPGAVQTAASVVVTSRAGIVAWSSGTLPTAAQSAAFPRALLAPATAYTWTVSVQASPSGPWLASLPSPFFTGASAAHWAQSAPVWAQPGDGTCSPLTPVNATPSFARFSYEAPIPPSADIESAFLYITGAPPVYADPWNVTKLLGGYSLRLGPAQPLLGVGPGRTACGPSSMGPCSPVQPYDGYDLTAAAQAAAASGRPLPLFVESYSLPQPSLGIAPAMQAVLVVRIVAQAQPVVFGTSASPSGGWSALNADGVRNPGENKAPNRWYFLPQENVNASCQLSPPPAAASPSSSPSSSSSPCCGWTSPAPAPRAWSDGTVPLAAKATQRLSVLPGVAPASVVQLGPGWWVADMGGEHQGGLEVRLLPSAAPGGSLPATVIALQLGEQLAPNGSALWQMRAGNKYRDVWSFPPAAAADEGSPALFAAHHEYCEFRWAEVLVVDAGTGLPLDIPLAALNLTGWTVRYPYDDDGSASVSTSSPDLDAVFALAARTLKVTTLDLVADSNTRQRSIDCQADDTTALLSFYATTTELALPRLVATQIMAIGDAGYISPDWADWTVLPALNVVYDALATGDMTLARPLLAVLAANHTYVGLVDPATGLVHNGDGLGALVDTSGGSDDGFRPSPWNAVVQAWSYAAMTAVAQLATELGEPAVAAQLGAAAAALKAGFNAAFVNASGTAVCDGLCSDVPHTAVHSSFYALAFGLVDDANLPAVWGYVRDRSFQDEIGVPCGTYPVQFLLQALYANGADHGVAAYGVLTSAAPHSWLNMMASFDATATMECWLPEELPNLSFSHVWSSSPAIAIPRYFFGLTATAPGAAALSVRPQPGPVLAGEATLPTARGPVSVAFRQTLPGGGTGACFELRTTTPGGTVLRAYLPLWGADPRSVNVTVDGAAVPAPSVGVEGDYVYVDGLGTGSHTVTSC